MNSEQRYQQGLALLQHLHGGEVGQQMVEELGDICPEIVDMTIEWGFGTVAVRTGIDLGTRELVTIAACTTLGHTTAQLAAHIASALKIGVSKEAIIDTLLQMIFYAGMAAVTNALRIAKRIFNEFNDKQK